VAACLNAWPAEHGSRLPLSRPSAAPHLTAPAAAPSLAALHGHSSWAVRRLRTRGVCWPGRTRATHNLTGCVLATQVRQHRWRRGRNNTPAVPVCALCVCLRRACWPTKRTSWGTWTSCSPRRRRSWCGRGRAAWRSMSWRSRRRWRSCGRCTSSSSSSCTRRCRASWRALGRPRWTRLQGCCVTSAKGVLHKVTKWRARGRPRRVCAGCGAWCRLLRLLHLHVCQSSWGLGPLPGRLKYDGGCLGGVVVRGGGTARRGGQLCSGGCPTEHVVYGPGCAAGRGS